MKKITATQKPQPSTQTLRDTEQMTRDLLRNLYKNSLGIYEKATEKLESQGNLDHLKANISFRSSIPKSSIRQEQQFEVYKKQASLAIEKSQKSDQRKMSVSG